MKLTVEVAEKKAKQHQKKANYYWDKVKELSKPVIGFQYKNKNK